MGFLDYFLRIVPRDVLKMYDNTNVAKEIPEIMPFFRLWAINATILWIIHISLGIVTTILTIIITYLSTTIDQSSLRPNISIISILAIIAAITAALLTTLNIGSKSTNTRNAWRKLNSAMMKYNQGILTKEQVIAIYEEGESTIGGVDINTPPAPQRPVAKIVPSQSTAKPGEKISLDASLSIGTNLTYLWRIVEGDCKLEDTNKNQISAVIGSNENASSRCIISLIIIDSQGLKAETETIIEII